MNVYMGNIDSLSAQKRRNRRHALCHRDALDAQKLKAAFLIRHLAVCGKTPFRHGFVFDSM
jgi:hypothetical protein